ncbi:MAG: prolipoprotein diacylglyceryl transferase [Phycisphaerales bacterium]
MLGWFHTLDPIIFRISGELAVRWYGVAYITGFILAYFWMQALSRRKLTPLSPAYLMDALTWLVMGVILGGRFGYVLFYSPELLITFSKSFPFWGVLMLNRGGMASHGGMIGVALACVALALRRDERGERPQMLHLFDVCALVCTPGLGLGRLANFVNGELLGRVVAPPGQKGPWWSVQYPQEVLEGHAPKLDNAQASALLDLCADMAPGQRFEAAYQRVLDLLHHGPAARKAEIIERLSPLVSSRHPSQLYQAFAESVVLGAALWFIWRRPRSPGVIAASFLIIYGAGRIITEFWRLPDADLALQRIAGLSRGQWLSAGMILIGGAALALISRRSAPKMGGWGAPHGPR